MTQKTATVTPFLPAYVGSKRRWLEELHFLQDRPIVELFAGSAILSAHFASRALLVDIDLQLCNVLSRYDELEVPDLFTEADYDRVRSSKDWWRYSYYLSAMSRGGSWRHSARGGFNVKARSDKAYSRRYKYELALERWTELKPEVRNTSYADVTNEDIREFGGDEVVVVLDPPFESTGAAYNSTSFDYSAYWARVAEIAADFDVLIFDTRENLVAAGYPIHGEKNLSRLGTATQNVEANCFLPAGTKLALRGVQHVARRSGRRRSMSVAAPRGRASVR